MIPACYHVESAVEVWARDSDCCVGRLFILNVDSRLNITNVVLLLDDRQRVISDEFAS